MNVKKKVLITGGSGFIGASLVSHCLIDRGWAVVNIDKLTYAAAQGTLASVEKRSDYTFYRLGIGDRDGVRKVLETESPDIIFNLAAESHVDRSIDGPLQFVQTNVLGTAELLETCRIYHDMLPAEKREQFRFHHVSTDEVYGSIGFNADKFTETTPYNPTSPYSASKAASDHIVRAWFRTYRFPIVVTCCSNNYGPYQFPEKLIPLMIMKALDGEDLPVYGNGENVRDWLFVKDHAEAITEVAMRGKLGETYNIGGLSELSNIDIVKIICGIMDEQATYEKHTPLEDRIIFVRDRPGHDLRYAIDNTKITTELGWSPKVNFDQGIRHTVKWYLENQKWWRPLLTRYDGTRLGTF